MGNALGDIVELSPDSTSGGGLTLGNVAAVLDGTRNLLQIAIDGGQGDAVVRGFEDMQPYLKDAAIYDALGELALQAHNKIESGDMVVDLRGRIVIDGYLAECLARTRKLDDARLYIDNLVDHVFRTLSENVTTREVVINTAGPRDSALAIKPLLSSQNAKGIVRELADRAKVIYGLLKDSETTLKWNAVSAIAS